MAPFAPKDPAEVEAATLYGALDGPIREGLQLLEHSELVCVLGIFSDIRYWSATRPGLATLASGKGAFRQRIKDRTGL